MGTITIAPVELYPTLPFFVVVSFEECMVEDDSAPGRCFGAQTVV